MIISKAFVGSLMLLTSSFAYSDVRNGRIENGKVFFVYSVMMERNTHDLAKEYYCLFRLFPEYNRVAKPFTRGYRLCDGVALSETISSHNNLPLLTDGINSVLMSRRFISPIYYDEGDLGDHYRYSISGYAVGIAEAILDSGKYKIIM
jgi:hypothetical protein